MRIKRGPGKPRLFEIVPQPSAMALHFLYHQFCSTTTHLEQSHENKGAHGDNSYTHYSVVPETCDDGDQNTTDDNQSHIAIRDMAIEKGSHGSVSEEIRGSKLPTKGVDALCVMVPETSDNGGQNATGGKQAPNAMDGMAIEEDSCGKVPENIHRSKVCSEIDWSEKEVCIKCDEGGKLLVCSNSNCPLAVHEECMRSSAHFDSKGNFFCPFCSYKQVVLAIRKAKKKAMLAKKALSVFLDRRKLEENVDRVKSGELNLPENDGVDNRCGGIQENCPEERSGRETSTSVVSCVGAMSSDVNEKNDVIGKCVDNGRSVNGRGETENQTVTEQASDREENRPEERSGRESGTSVGATSIDVNEKNDVIDKCGDSGRSINGRGETENQTVTEQASDREETPKIVDDFQNEVWHDQEEAVIRKRRKLSVEPEKSVEGTLDDGETGAEEENPKFVDGFQNKRVERHDQETSVIGKKSNVSNEPEESNPDKVQKEKSKTRIKPRQPITNTGFPIVNRKRVLWTAEEEEMLKEGVGRFSSTTNKNIPWKKILLFGRHIFHGTRTADSLKDKWRSQSR